MNLTRNDEVADLFPGLAQWVKDLALLRAVLWVTDMPGILHCCGSGAGQWLQLQLDHLAWAPPYAVGAAQEKAKRQK